MPSLKRPIEAVHDSVDSSEPAEMLHRIRNMWQFANLSQWICLFGKAAKIDDAIDTDELEAECLKPNSTILTDIALAILKLVSSHRGLTPEILDDQARKAYLARKPDQNPFGDGDDKRSFSNFDVFTKIRVLQQLTQWAMDHPERVRDKMEEQRDVDQTTWRIEPYGWDSQDRTYFVLDDNRIYRMTEPPPPPAKSKKRKRSHTKRRTSTRHRKSIGADEELPDDECAEAKSDDEPGDNGLGRRGWECVAVTFSDVQGFLNSIKKSRDENEKILRKQLEDHLVPILEKQEEARKRRELQRERELLNLAKMANAKRSSRIASRVEQRRQEEKAQEDLKAAQEALKGKQREDAHRAKMEVERDYRMFSREKRLREREARRKQHEDDLASLSQENAKGDTGKARSSERRIQAEIEQTKRALLDLGEEEEDWVFDCICGVYGHIDDGTHSIACERCNIWQHSQCLGVTEEEAERAEFHFVCSSCVRREKEASSHPKPTIKLRLHRPDNSVRQVPEIDETNAASSDKVANLLMTGTPTNAGASTLSVGSHSQESDQRTQNGHGPQPRSTDHAPSTGDGDVGNAGPISTTDLFFKCEISNTTERKDVISERTTIPATDHASPMRQEHSIPSTVESPRQLGDLLITPAVPPLPPPRAVASGTDYRAGSYVNTPDQHVKNSSVPSPRVIQADVLPANGGLSPTKHSPQTPCPSASVKTGTTSFIPPVPPLQPSPQQTILTPPVKLSTLDTPASGQDHS